MNGINYEDYEDFLRNDDFNNEQIKFLIAQRKNYEVQRKEEYFDYDTYERDMWYTMNRSGLFEKDSENKTEIYDWDSSHTRLYITETD